MLNPRPTRSIVTVVFTWWLVLTVLTLLYRPDAFLGAVGRASVIVTQLVLGLVSGLVCIVAVIWGMRSGARRMLRPDEVRGLKCTIGEVPFLIKEPPSADALPALDRLPDVPAGFYEGWIKEHGEKHAAHVALLEKLLRILEGHKTLPATSVPGGHGGRSLLEHSALCGYIMHVVAQSWEWKGYINRKGKAVLQLRDANYKFDPSDPMAVVIGLAHDIGKIESYIWEGGRIVAIRHEHDMTGARMLARMPEVWDLPQEDQFALMMSVAHYHRPMDLPLLPDRRAIDDRTVALMELLIRVDTQASAVEKKGRMLTPEEEEQLHMVVDDAGIALTAERIWEEMDILLAEPDRIDSRDPRQNIGSYCQVVGANTPLLVLHEESLRMVLATRFGVDPDAKLGDGRSKITVEILKSLHQHEALRLSMKATNASGKMRHYKPESALWQIGFWKNGKTKSDKPQFDRIAGWVGILVDPGKFEGLRMRLTPYTWTAQVEDGLWRGSRALKAPYSDGKEEAEGAGATADDLASQESPTEVPAANEAQPSSCLNDMQGVELTSDTEERSAQQAPAQLASPLADRTEPVFEPDPAREQAAVVELGNGASTSGLGEGLQEFEPPISGAFPEDPAAAEVGAQSHDAAGSPVAADASSRAAQVLAAPNALTPLDALQSGVCERGHARSLEQPPQHAEVEQPLAEPTAQPTAQPTEFQDKSGSPETVEPSSSQAVAVAPVVAPVQDEAAIPTMPHRQPAEPEDSPSREADTGHAKRPASRLKVRKPNNELALKKAFAGQMRSRPTLPMDSLPAIRRMLQNAKSTAEGQGLAVTTLPDGTFALTSEQIEQVATGIEMSSLARAAEVFAADPENRILFRWADTAGGPFFLGLRGPSS